VLSTGSIFGDNLGKGRVFSLYDVEQFLREAGAKKINEKALVSLEQELEETAARLIDEAQMYASYAGRNLLINKADVSLASRPSSSSSHTWNRKPALATAISRRKAAIMRRAARAAYVKPRQGAVINYDKEKDILC
jgi:histone H3/H4